MNDFTRDLTGVTMPGEYHVSDTSSSKRRRASQAESPSALFCEVAHYVSSMLRSIPLSSLGANVEQS